ncbi:MAG TPA: hypothetical protein VHV10_16290 [Ktedonobacteraceae bacterium]|nr:hypothetical protein [Ktedonobacteraceae bacterium]
MHFYNAIQAAKYIGCDPKTVRRMLKRGELTGERTERGWLAIPGGQVEYAKIKWEEEQAKFARPWLSKESSGEVPRDALDTLGRDDMDIIRRVEALEQKVAELEKALSNASLHVPTQSMPQPATSDIPPKTKPSARNVATSSPIPDGWVLCSDFFEARDIKETTCRRWLKDGLQGEYFEFEEVPRPGRVDKYRYFNSIQQEKALELLRKYGKLS